MAIHRHGKPVKIKKATARTRKAPPRPRRVRKSVTVRKPRRV